jgi:hypothetical protein
MASNGRTIESNELERCALIYSIVQCLTTAGRQYIPLLGYRKHHSIGYTCLFTTPLVITISVLQ